MKRSSVILVIILFIFLLIINTIWYKYDTENKKRNSYDQLVDYGYMNIKGEWVIEPKLQALETKHGLTEDLTFYCDIAEFNHNNRVGLINEHGKVVVRPTNYKKADYYNEHYWVKNDDDLWGYIDYSGNYIIKPKYDYIYTFTDSGYALVREESTSNQSGHKEIESKRSVIDLTGNVVSDFNNDYYISNLDFVEGMKSFQDSNRRYGFIDSSWQIAIEPQYSVVHDFSENLAAVRNNDGKYGYINKSGDVEIDFSFYEVGPFSEGLAYTKVNEDDKFYTFINNKGETVFTTPEELKGEA